MKLFLWILVGLVTIAIAAWIITANEGPQNPFLLALVVIVFCVPPIGGLWMMYVSIRYEKHPLRMILLAYFVPYAFLWYYFERVRPGKHVRRNDTQTDMT
jgi:hypothetical protein